MIDQASVYAERFKGNRQALQAAVLGQSNQVDPYTALRALQLLKESDAMAMAQQAQGPTEQPSLMQEALQPPQPQGIAGMMPNMMPAGQPVPGQAPQGAQMGQAPMPQGQQPMPQQMASGGLAMMPVSDADYADGGIVSFSTGDSVPSVKPTVEEAKTALQEAQRTGDRKAVMRMVKVLAALGYDAATLIPRAFMGVAEDISNTRLGRVLGVDYKLPEAAYGGDRTSMYPMLDQLGRTYRSERGEQASEAPPPPQAQQAPPPPQALQAPQAPDPTQTDPGYIASGIPQTPPVHTVLDPTKTGGGINRQPLNSPPMPNMFDVNAYIGAANTFEPTKIEPYEPKSREAMIASAQQEGRDTLKNFFGTDKAAEKSQAILNKRLAELDDPENSKYDRAMAWFKGAAAMQEGSRPLKAMANAFGEVASGYSALKKEQRKARSLIEDSQMLLDRAEQARKDGFSTKALADEETAEVRRLEGHKLKVDISAKQDQLRLQATQIAAQAATNVYSTQVTGRGQDIVARTAAMRIAMDEKMQTEAAASRIDNKLAVSYSAASETLRRAEEDVKKARKDDPNYERNLRTIQNAKDPSKSSTQEKQMLEKAKNYIATVAGEETRRLTEAQDRFNFIAKKAFKDFDPKKIGNGSKEAEALKWARDNPNDSRSAEILKMLGK